MKPSCLPPDFDRTPVVYANAMLGKGHEAAVDYLAVINPITLAVTDWVPLDACKAAGFLDMAVDRHGMVYLGNGDGLYQYDPEKKSCTVIRHGVELMDFNYYHYPMPNNLTVAPLNLWSPSAGPEEETLIGYGLTPYDDDHRTNVPAGYLRIDPKTGDITLMGPFPPAPGMGLWAPSGDLVSVVDPCAGRAIAWAAVFDQVPAGTRAPTLCRICEPGMQAGLDCGNCLTEFDLKTGTFTKTLGLLPSDLVFGLAYWGGTLIGATGDGKLYSIDIKTSPIATTELTFTAPAGYDHVYFNGAGSTTLAPIIM
jgi:hypothetical protein